MPYLSFQFPWNIDAVTAVQHVADHFGVAVTVNGAALIPAHLKAAVETVGAGLLAAQDNPEHGTETNPAIAFGGLVNGAFPNGAPSSAGAAASPTAPVVLPGTSATTPPASSATAPTPGNSAGAPVASAGQANLAGIEFDSSGLPWDERIHSGNKTKSPSGEWRTKKGVDKALVKRVTDELRAAVGSGTSAVAAPPVTSVSTAEFVSEQQRKSAVLEYAHNEAVRVAGPQIIDNDVLRALLNNQPQTLTPQQNEWFTIYYAKRGAAYQEFMARPNVPATTATAAPVPLPPTGTTPAAQPAAPLTVDAGQTAAGGTAAPAPNAPPSQAGQTELDAAGLPHDVRINIPLKIKDTAGVWVQRVDVAPEVKLSVMAELRAALGNVAAQASSTPAGPASTPVAPPPAPVGATAAEARGDFVKLMQWIVANQMAGRITPTSAGEAAKSMGVVDSAGNGSLTMLNSAQYVPYLTYLVDALIAQGAQ